MIKQRHYLRKKEGKKILIDLENAYGVSIEGNVETAYFKDVKLLFCNSKIIGFFIKNKPMFTINSLKNNIPSKKFVTVDDGAIKFILNGADIMAPGIVDADSEILQDDIIWIKDMRNLPIAVGIATMDGISMKHKDKGKAVKTYHFIGDSIWMLENSDHHA